LQESAFVEFDRFGQSLSAGGTQLSAAVDMAGTGIQEADEVFHVQPVVGVRVEPNRFSRDKQKRRVGLLVIDSAPEIR
jgi:hypothetical protein